MFGGVAFLDGEILRAETRLNVKVAHSERLLGEVHLCLERCAVRLDDVDVLALAIGPGSFTGLRVGLSTVKGLAFATGKPVVAVSTLEALAWNAAFSAYPVCPLLDARKREVYGAVYRWAGSGFENTVPEGAYSIGKLLQKLSEPTLFLGEGALAYRSEIESAMGTSALFGTPGMTAPSPAQVAWLGARSAHEGAFVDPVSLTPRYCRRSEAELKSGT